MTSQSPLVIGFEYHQDPTPHIYIVFGINVTTRTNAGDDGAPRILRRVEATNIFLSLLNHSWFDLLSSRLKINSFVV